jgi:hypothetical protein
MRFQKMVIFAVAHLLAFQIEAQTKVPICTANKKAIAIDDQQVLKWKKSTQNQFRARAHVQGTIEQVYSDQTGHDHFAIRIGPAREDLLEVVYNSSFGDLGNLIVGSTVQACGDYITANQPTGRYPVSPAGAIIHWVHQNPNGRGHESGFLVIDGKIFGQRR